MPTPYVYPPFYAWMLAPLTASSYDAAKGIILLVGALVLTLGVALAVSDFCARRTRWVAFLVAPLLLLLFNPLDYNNWLGQISTVVFGLIYAVLIDRTRGEALSKALIFLPMAISLVGASIIWKFMYEYRDASRPQIGLLNQILVWLGVDPYQFLLTSPWNTFFLLVVLIWIQTGFAMTVLSAAIKAIPDDIIEAARLDGVTGLGMFFPVTAAKGAK